MALSNQQSAYDDDADGEFRPNLIHDEEEGDGVPQGNLHSIPPVNENQALESSALRTLEGGGEGDGIAKGKLRAVGDEESTPLGNVRAGEQAGSEGSLYNGDKDTDRGVRQRLKSRLGKFTSKKWLIGGGLVGAGLVALLLLLFLFLSSLKLPSIMQNIEGYEFARLTRQFAQSAQNTTDEATALEAAPDGVYAQLKEKFTNTSAYKSLQDIRNSTWGRLDAYRPGKIIQNLGNDNGLTFTYKESAIPGRSPIFTGAVIDGEPYNIEPITGIAKWVPGVRQLVGAQKAAAWRNTFMPKVMATERVQNLGPVMRFRVSYAIRKEAGSGFAGWILENFVNKSGANADAEATQEMAQATEQGMTNPETAITDEVKNADEAVRQELEAEATDPKVAAAVTANNGDSPQVQTAADSALNESTFLKVTDVLGGLYGIVTPLCIIYDGSVQQSQAPIDNQMNEEENSFDKLAAEADQQKQGTINPVDDTALANAVQGTGDDIGNVQDSVPYQRAAGGTVDTSDQLSPESGAGGGYTYSVFNLLGLSPQGFISTWLNAIVGNVCPVITTPEAAAVFAAANLAATVASGGTAAGVEKGAAEAAQQTAKEVVTKMAQTALKKLVAKQVIKKGNKIIERSALNRAMRFAFKQGLIVGGTIGLTELAHLEVAARAGEATSGFAQGPDLVTNADSGASIEANKLEQQQLFGRPMTSDEVTQSDQADSSYMANNNAGLSFVQRYFSPSNPNSLITHMAMAMGSNLRMTLFQKIINLGASLLQPLNSLSSLLSLSGAAHAAPDPSTLHYGNVQFGWSESEQNLINSNDNYKPLENQLILDNSSKEVDIAKTYAKCFGYKYIDSGNGDLDPTDESGNLQRDTESSLGNLLAKADIQRDDNGNVVDAGDCSPKNLGPNNPTYGDLVFRWRLAMEYDTSLDQLIGEQDVTNS